MNITRNAAMVAVAAAAAFFASVPSALAQSPARSAQEIDQIVGPIALYPDPLVSIVLPASTRPDEVEAAARVAVNVNASVDNPAWDDSVRAVAHYPDLVVWMSDNIEWTAQLGATFATQPADVLNSIQRLRARARAVGTLVDTPQQRVVVEGSLIAIVPAEPARIYVPRYDPAIVYVEHPSRRGPDVFTFGAGFALGAWMTYDFDWQRHSIVVVDRATVEHRDWSQPSFAVVGTSRTVGDTAIREWHPAPNRTQVNVNVSKTVVTPHVMGERTASVESRQSRLQTERNETAAPSSTDATRTQGALSQTQIERSTTSTAAPSATTTATAPSTATAAAPLSTTTASKESAPAKDATAQASTDRSFISDRDRAPDTNERRPAMAATPATPATPGSVGTPATPATPADPATRNRASEANPNNSGALSQTPTQPGQPTSVPAASKETSTQTPAANRPTTGSSSTMSSTGTPRSPQSQDNSAASPTRRPTPRGSVTAGSSGEYPQAPEARSTTATPDKTNPSVQSKTETEEEKAKRLKEEEDKKKKPDGTNGE